MSLKQKQGRSLIVLLGLAVAACAIPRGLPTGSYPVRATLEATVEGRPVKATRVFRCEEYIVTHYGCPGCIKWRSTLDRIAEPLPSGSVLLARMGIGCDGDPLKAVGHNLTSIAWADKLEQPNRVEIYETKAPAVSDIYAKNPKILVRSLRFSLERLTEGEAMQSDTDAEKKAGWFGVVSTQETSGMRPRELSGLSTIAIPRRAWSQLPWLADEIRKTTAATEFDFPLEKRKELYALQKKAWDEFKEGKSDSPISFDIPGKYVGGDGWVLDEENVGIRVLYFVGMVPIAQSDSKADRDELSDKIKKRYNSQFIQIDSGRMFLARHFKYVFVPGRDDLFTTGSGMEMNDYSVVE